MRRQSIATLADVVRLESLVATSGQRAATRLQQLLQVSTGLDTLARLKFAPVGCDPLDPERPLNVVEQLNQTFTYLASFAAAKWLLAKHPGSAPYTLNLGTMAGTDIVSADGQVAGEVFAATHPDSNDKLRKDMDKIGLSGAAHKYVFYLSPKGSRKPPRPGIQAIRLEHACLVGL